MALDQNVVVLANVAEFAARVIMNVAGNDTSNTLGGVPISEPYVIDAVTARLQAKLMPFTGSAAHAE